MDWILHVHKNMKTLVKNGWLTVEWSYLVYRNIGEKIVIGPLEEVENNILYISNIILKIYEIKMDIYSNNFLVYMVTHLVHSASLDIGFYVVYNEKDQWKELKIIFYLVGSVV